MAQALGGGAGGGVYMNVHNSAAVTGATIDAGKAHPRRVR